MGGPIAGVGGKVKGLRGEKEKPHRHGQEYDDNQKEDRGVGGGRRGHRGTKW